jgi:hypothetical protein
MQAQGKGQWGVRSWHILTAHWGWAASVELATRHPARAGEDACMPRAHAQGTFLGCGSHVSHTPSQSSPPSWSQTTALDVSASRKPAYALVGRVVCWPQALCPQAALSHRSERRWPCTLRSVAASTLNASVDLAAVCMAGVKSAQACTRAPRFACHACMWGRMLYSACAGDHSEACSEICWESQESKLL